jgi:hypothetical protein
MKGILPFPVSWFDIRRLPPSTFLLLLTIWLIPQQIHTVRERPMTVHLIVGMAAAFLVIDPVAKTAIGLVMWTLVDPVELTTPFPNPNLPLWRRNCPRDANAGRSLLTLGVSLMSVTASCLAALSSL